MNRFTSWVSSYKKRMVLAVAAAGLFYTTTSFKDDFFEIAKQLEIFTELYKTVNMNYVDELSPAELMDKAVKSMLADLDPYTTYFNEGDVVRYKINNTGEYTGMGASIVRKDGIVSVREAYKGYAADKAGLKAGDEIIKVGDVLLSEYEEDASQLFRGSKGTKITIQYRRQGKVYDAQLVLDEVEVKAVPFYDMVDATTGYIVLSQFNQKASSETKQALEALKEKGAKKIILDLRGNPGGLLNEAVNICNLFVPKGEVIVTTKSKVEKHNNTYRTAKEPIDTEIPLVVLVDGKSASASEIVSGGLQDLDRAVVVGTRSFGKGLVQRPIDLTYGTQVKVTISRYYTPSGRCIQALDYSRKDKDGKATRTDASQYNAFKTKNGRTVYDGGGIQPDVELPEAKMSYIATALQKNDGIFRYATDFYYKNPIPENGIPNFTSAKYAEFKQFLKANKISFDTETEVALKKTLESAKKEKLDQSIAKEYEQLLAAVKRSEDVELNKYETEITKLIVDELIKRYAYKEGLYKYYLTNDTQIKKATELLANTASYNKILKK